MKGTEQTDTSTITTGARRGRPRSGPNLICPVCLGAFHRPPSQIRGRTVCCSKACSYVGRRTRVSLTCANPACGREFLRSRSAAAKHGDAHYCSGACFLAAVRSEDLRCANPDCGGPLRRRPSLRRQSRSGEFCCSVECRHALDERRRAEKQSGR